MADVRFVHIKDSRFSSMNIPEQSMDQLKEAISFFDGTDIPFGLLIPTPTALGKNILDANGSVREMLGNTKAHDFSKQPQGQEYKKELNGVIINASDIMNSKVTVYRPKTKKGDPRLWFFGLAGAVAPYSVLALISDGRTIFAVDFSNPPTRENRKFTSILRSCTIAATQSPVEQLLAKLIDIHKQGLIPAVGYGDTTVGMTLENLLDIAPNSYAAPDWNGIELKTNRLKGNMKPRKAKDPRHGRSSLFSLKPCWCPDHSLTERKILDRFGLRDKNERLGLYCTIYGKAPNPNGFQLEADRESDQLRVVHKAEGLESSVATWHMASIRESLRIKHTRTAWIDARTQVIDGKEYFDYCGVTFTERPNFMEFENLVESNGITVDFTISEQPTERNPYKTRNHGYLFKASPRGFNTLFSEPVFVDLETPSAQQLTLKE